MKEDSCPLCGHLMQVADDARALLCGSCVQRLLQMNAEQKLELITTLRERGRDRAGEAIERFSGLGRHAPKRAAERPENVLLVDFRKSRKLTQEQLADEWGISRQYLQQMEAGKRAVSRRFFRRMQATL